MNDQVKQLTLSLLNNNEVIMNQTQEINTERGESNQAIENMRKIYDGVRKKVESGDQLTPFDCKFLVMAGDIGKAALQRQLGSVELAIMIQDELRDLYTEASGYADPTDVLERGMDVEGVMNKFNTRNKTKN